MELKPQLTLEEKRQVVYSSLCRYASEAAPLRQRALDRVVLGALLGSTADNAFRVGRIQENLSFGSLEIEIRAETIQEALERLQSEGKVGYVLQKQKHAYYLTSSGEEEVAQISGSSEALFRDVIAYLFRDTYTFFPSDISSAIFRRFAFECFARFGRQIAKSVTGTITRDELVGRIDARVALQAAIGERSLTREQLDTLEVRCQRFLTSTEPICEKLKFYLTQGYYFTQLVGLEQARFNPLADEAFRGATFYIDTNVLLSGLFLNHDEAPQFAEVVRLSGKLGIELRVSRATITETRHSVMERVPIIEKIVGVIPEELAERTLDNVLKAYYQGLEANPSLTIYEFLRPFEDIEQYLRDTWKITIDEREAIDMIAGHNIDYISAVLNEEAEKARGWGKKRPVLEHDVAHYLAVTEERKQNPKTWFLSRDTSLEGASIRLLPDDPPFNFSHVGFLQSISPFVTSASEEHSLADVMSGFISDQIRPFESLFDISELSLMAEFNEDVMATPPDQLVMAFDYIKTRTLRGARYRAADIPRVSLDLRKFLAADKNEQLQTLQAERQRLADEARIERELRIAAEEQARSARQREGALESEIANLKRDMAALSGQLMQQREQSLADSQRRRLWYTVGGSALGLFVLSRIPAILDYTLARAPQLTSLTNVYETFLRVLAGLMFAVPAGIFVRKTTWKNEGKIVGFGVIAVVVLAVGDLIPSETLSKWSDLIGVGTMVASIVTAFLLREKKTEAQ